MERTGQNVPFINPVSSEKELVRLVYSKKPEDFIPLFQWEDTEHSDAFAEGLSFCDRYGQEWLKQELFYIAKNRLGVVTKRTIGMGNRADLFAQVASALMMPAYFGEGSGDGKKQKEKNT